MGWCGGVGEDCCNKLEEAMSGEMFDQDKIIDLGERTKLLKAVSELAKSTEDMPHHLVIEACLITMVSLIATTIPPQKHQVIITSLAQTMRKMLNECIVTMQQ
jgi:hypothetical protein